MTPKIDTSTVASSMSDAESDEDEAGEDEAGENSDDGNGDADKGATSGDGINAAGADNSEVKDDDEGANAVTQDEGTAGVAQASESTIDKTKILLRAGNSFDTRTSSFDRQSSAFDRQTTAGVSEDGGEGLAPGEKKKKKVTVPDGMISVSFYNPKAPEKYRHKKVVMNTETCVMDIRKMSCMKIGCNFKDLQLEINGNPQWVGRLQPFKEYTEKTAKIKWKKIKRLTSFIEYNKVGGLNGRDGRYGRTVLHYGAIVGDLEICQEALNDKTIDPGLINVRDKLGDTALTLASIAGFHELANLFIEKLADIETQNVKGRTAMLLAAEHGHSEVVQTLLIANANIGPVPGTTRPTPMYLAELNQRDGVRLTIKQYIRNQQGDPLFDL
eukprot:TRINITY_DN56806_c0_g1_i1.p1 TRINITY_DN56806_c0_g1~~TRINITY_DN56806_c0_g1_i1.p1  ORF type:complete len:385 (-),score=78.78 TRINITY_DN56806_c0_g1_i1:39-1193(-)